MSARNKLVVTTPSDLEIEMTRDFDAPRALVWEMFTKPEHVRQWWGTGHVEMVVCEIDFRVGGKYRYVGKTPDGREVPFCGEHHEIVYPEKIVFTEIYDVDMAREHPSLITTTFTETNGKTTMRLVAKYDSKQTRDIVLSSGMEKGAAKGYDKIEELVGGLAQLTIEREFAAPRKLVWAAWTEPAQFAKWFGPHGMTVPRVEFDLRPGGALRYDMRREGMTMTIVGAFTEVIDSERLAYTERSEHDGKLMSEHLNTVTFVERSGKTVLTLTMTVLVSGMDPKRYIGGAGAGWNQALDKLGELLAK